MVSRARRPRTSSAMAVIVTATSLTVAGVPLPVWLTANQYFPGLPGG
jgi:hypothetical protein